MRPKHIIDLLTNNYALRQFITTFHNRLAVDNPAREVGINRTYTEIAMDSLGRLLVGDEVCVAVATEGSTLYISSNFANHSQAQASFSPTHFEFVRYEHHAEVRLTVILQFRNDEGQLMPPSTRTFTIGYYDYDRQRHRIILREGSRLRFEVPYEEHRIVQYPYPIGLSLNHIPEVPYESAEIWAPGTDGPQAFLNAADRAPRIFRLDPLFRRSAILFAHLGMITLAISHGPMEYDIAARASNAVAQHRLRVMVQTIGWEATTWYKLAKTIRRYDDSRLTRSAKREHRKKQSDIRELHQFIEDLTREFNDFLNSFQQPIRTNKLMALWRLRINEIINQRQIPGIIQDSRNFPIERFLEQFNNYLASLNYLEQDAARRATYHPDAYTRALSEIGRREVLGQENADGRIELVDTQLAPGTHAEVHQFYHFLIANHRNISTIPYFGITQLCCACCNTLFKAHGLHFEQGTQRHRAGTHASQYSGWILDPQLRIERVLRPFFGDSYTLYERLAGEYTSENETHTLQDWACLIIQDLASLFYKATPQQLEQLRTLGFQHDAIDRDGSSYPEDDFSQAIYPEGVQSRFVEPAQFRRALEIDYNIEIDEIVSDGDCQFRAITRALNSLDPRSYRQLQTQGGFTFFHAPLQERTFIDHLRQRVITHINTNENAFAPFLATEVGRRGVIGNQDLIFSSMAEYIRHMEQANTFGDNITLQAASNLYERPIIILQPGEAQTPIDVQFIFPINQDQLTLNIEQAIILVYNGRDHYDLVNHAPETQFSEAFYTLIENRFFYINGNSEERVIISNIPKP